MARINSIILIIIVIFFSTISCNTNKKKNTGESLHSGIDQLIDKTFQEKSDNLKDSLAKKVLSIKNDSVRLNYIFKVSYQYYLTNDSINFRQWNDGTFELAEKTGNVDRMAEAHWDLGNFLYKQNAPDSAYFHYFNAHNLYKKAGNDYYSARMSLNMGIMQENFKDFVGSEVTTIDALKIFEDLDKKKQQYISYSNLGVVFNGLEDWENSLKYHRKALQVASKLKDSVLVAKTLNNIGITYKDQENYSESIEYYKMALAVDSLFYKDPKLFATLLDNQGYAKFRRDPLGNEHFYLATQSLKIRDSINDISGKIINKIHLAEYSKVQGEISEAIKLLKDAKSMAEEINEFEYLLTSLKLLFEFDSSEEQNHIEEYLRLNDSLTREERRIRNKFARIRYETDQYIEETKILSKQRLWISGLGILITISLILAYFYRNQRAKNKELLMERAQQESNEKIYELLLAQQQKKEEGKHQERSRISSELHDGVLGKLFGIRMNMGFLDLKKQPDLSPYLNELQTLEKEIRDISHDLIKNTKDSEAFITIIENLIEEKSGITDINFKFRKDNDLDLEEIPGNVQINIYRLLQESIQNIIKHAEASNVIIVFLKKEDALIIEIEDDGIGFHLERTKKGIGLKNMKERISKINGTIDIDTSSKGTKIIFKIPLT